MISLRHKVDRRRERTPIAKPPAVEAVQSASLLVACLLVACLLGGTVSDHRCMDTANLAPDFTLPDQTGTPRSLSEFLADGPVALFFYPAAMTPGCTAEGCHFRDMAAEFEQVGARRVGISPDPVAKQAEFSAKHGLDYPLLSDVDGAIAAQFGVRRKIGPMKTKRKTFIIDSDKCILDAVASEIRMNVHAERALAVLRARQDRR